MPVIRNIESIESEIRYQILFAELGFWVCKTIPIIPGRGEDIIPYFYNLNYSKGIIALHSLLLSNQSEEISFKNYFTLYKNTTNRDIDTEIKNGIVQAANKFTNIYQSSLRHKVIAHISSRYSHTDFTRAYIMPNTVDPLLEIVQDVKNIFLPFTNYNASDSPFVNIQNQVSKIIEQFT